jgi:guanylate kinase
VDYEYVSVEQFQTLIRRGAMLDWDFALRNYYGYRIDLGRRVASGENVVIHALARMALRIAAQTPNVFLVFLDSPNDVLLEQRLARRKLEDLEMQLRKLHWWEERQHSAMFDVALIDADRAADEQLTLVLADVLGKFG